MDQVRSWRDFEYVVRDVADPVRRYLLRRTDAITADDVLSETLLVLWRRQSDIPAEPVPWAIGVARLQLSNAVRSHRRRERLKARITSHEPRAVADVADDPLSDAVAAVLRTMREADQEILRLWAWDQMQPMEIAVVLGTTVNAATVRLHRARRRFESAWGKNARPAGHKSVNTKKGTR